MKKDYNKAKENGGVIATTENGIAKTLHGHLAEDFVKRYLWNYGYKVKHLPKNYPFDLWVDEKYRVEVKSARPNRYHGHWQIPNPLTRNTSVLDVLIIALFSDWENEKPQLFFFDKDACKKLFSSKSSVALKECDIRLSFGHPSPYKVFGKPKKLSPVA